MTDAKQIAAVEAVLFAAAEPVEYTRLASVLGYDDEQVLIILDEIEKKLSDDSSGICLVKLDTKYQLCSKKDYIEPIRTLLDLRKNAPLSQAAFEVLAIIAYNQPITKPYIEQIRGVDCSGVVNTLCVKGLIEEKGRLEVPGKPVLYGTTSAFLRCFSLESLHDLPPLPENDREVLMSDVDNGQMSLFDGVEEDASDAAREETPDVENNAD